MASLAKFTALSLTVLVESRRVPGWEASGNALSRLQSLSAALETGWSRCPLAGVREDSDLAGTTSINTPSTYVFIYSIAEGVTREIATATWQVMKTVLFTTLMILQSILSTVVFVPHPHGERYAPSSSTSAAPSPYAIALEALHTLSHLSFVMPQFGGVASTSEGGLPELKRAFYMALDVLSASEVEAGRFVQELCRHSGTTTAKGKGEFIYNIKCPVAAY